MGKKLMAVVLAGAVLLPTTGIARVDWDEKRDHNNDKAKDVPGEMQPGAVLMGALDLRGHEQASGFSDRLITMATVYGIASDRHRENAIEELYLNLDLRDLDGEIGYYVALKSLSHDETFFVREDVRELEELAQALAQASRSRSVKKDATEIARRANQCVKWIEKGRDNLEKATEQAVLAKHSMTDVDEGTSFQTNLTTCQNALIYMPRVMSPLIPQGY